MNSNISLKQLIVFSKIVENRSVSVVAEMIHVTPSAVSKILQSLEETLGIQLINRTTRNIFPTEKGLSFYDDLTPILSQLEAAFENASSKKDEPNGELRVTCSIALGTAHMMKFISEYRAQYPDVRLIVNLSDKLENLNEGDFDIALRIVSKPPENLAVKKLTAIKWKYCASPEYFNKNGFPGSPSEMINHDCLIYPGLESAWDFKTVLNSKRLMKNNSCIIQANSSLALLEAALLSQGIAYLPAYLCSSYLKKGQLIEIFSGHHAEKNHFLYALYVPQKQSSPMIRTFIDFLENRFSPVPPWEL